MWFRPQPDSGWHVKWCLQIFILTNVSDTGTWPLETRCFFRQILERLQIVSLKFFLSKEFDRIIAANILPILSFCIENCTLCVFFHWNLILVQLICRNNFVRHVFTNMWNTNFYLFMCASHEQFQLNCVHHFQRTFTSRPAYNNKILDKNRSNYNWIPNVFRLFISRLARSTAHNQQTVLIQTVVFQFYSFLIQLFSKCDLTQVVCVTQLMCYLRLHINAIAQFCHLSRRIHTFISSEWFFDFIVVGQCFCFGMLQSLRLTTGRWECMQRRCDAIN